MTKGDVQLKNKIKTAKVVEINVKWELDPGQAVMFGDHRPPNSSGGRMDDVYSLDGVHSSIFKVLLMLRHFFELLKSICSSEYL